MGFVGEVLGVKKIKIDYQEDDNRKKLVIPEIAQAEIESIQGISGGEAKIENAPLCIVPSHPSVVSRSLHYRYQDYDHDWEFSKLNGFQSPFVYQP